MSNNNNEDFVHKIGRPDYYTIIKRRRRSMENILAEHGVDSLKKLRQFKKSLEGAYTVSQEFMSDAECILHEMSLSKAGKVIKVNPEKPKTPSSPKKKKTTKKKPKKKTAKKDASDKTE
jgi:hypothetical protein